MRTASGHSFSSPLLAEDALAHEPAAAKPSERFGPANLHALSLGSKPRGGPDSG